MRRHTEGWPPGTGHASLSPGRRTDRPTRTLPGHSAQTLEPCLWVPLGHRGAPSTESRSRHSHSQPSSTGGGFQTATNPGPENPGCEERALNPRQQNVEEAGGRWGALCPGGPGTPLVHPQVTVTEPTRPSSPGAPPPSPSVLFPPQQHPSQTSGPATLCLKHCLPGVPGAQPNSPQGTSPDRKRLPRLTLFQAG